MKLMILLTRRDDMSPEEFSHWWLVEHAPRARELPGVRRIVFNLAHDADDIDGIAELWFDSREAMEAAYASEIGQAVAADSLAHLARRVRLVVDEHAIAEAAST